VVVDEHRTGKFFSAVDDAVPDRLDRRNAGQCAVDRIDQGFQDQGYGFFVSGAFLSCLYSSLPLTECLMNEPLWVTRSTMPLERTSRLSQS